MSEAQRILPKEEYGELVVVPFEIELKKGQLLLCLNVQKILEVIDLEDLSPLPESHLPFVGIFDHRLGPVPVLDISFFLQQNITTFEKDKTINLSLHNKSRHKQKRIIFCHLHNLIIGLIVDNTKRIEAVKNVDVLPVPRAIDKSDENVFNGIIRYQSKLLYMLDVEKILSDIGANIDSPDFSHNEQAKWLLGKKVLVVEDSLLFRKKLEKIFLKHGSVCTFAHDGKEGLKKATDASESFDLIFTDIEMPLMNGIEMVRKLKNTPNFKTPIIFNSSISNELMIEEIQKEKLGHFIIKFSEEAILIKTSEVFKAA